MVEVNVYEAQARQLRANGVNVSAEEVKQFCEASEGLIKGAEGDKIIADFKNLLEQKVGLTPAADVKGWQGVLARRAEIKQQLAEAAARSGQPATMLEHLEVAMHIPCTGKFIELTDAECFCNEERWDDFLHRHGWTWGTLLEVLSDKKRRKEIKYCPRGFYPVDPMKYGRCRNDLAREMTCDILGRPFLSAYYREHPEHLKTHAHVSIQERIDARIAAGHEKF